LSGDVAGVPLATDRPATCGLFGFSAATVCRSKKSRGGKTLCAHGECAKDGYGGSGRGRLRASADWAAHELGIPGFHLERAAPNNGSLAIASGADVGVLDPMFGHK